MPTCLSPRLLCAAAALVCLFGAAYGTEGQTKIASSPVQLHAGIPIIVDAGDDPAILAAVADLRRDLRKVLGSESPLLSAEQASSSTPAIIVHCTSTTANDPTADPLPEAEAYSISLDTKNAVHILLQGSDIRGTIYSIYEFSDKALGVPPLWFWSGWRPNPQPTITLSPAVFRKVKGPDVRWRAWFPNDTDMLAPWLSASDDHTDLFLETLLRLRFNVLDVDHVSNWDNHPNSGLVMARRCKARGVKITFTHLAPFGFLLGDWDRYWSTVRHVPPPPRLLSNLTALDEFWTYAIHFVEDEHLDVIQSVEFRVDGDKPFWRSFTDSPTDEGQRAQIISSMLSHQMKLLRKVSRGPIPVTRTVFYNEVGEFLDRGELIPPKDPMLIWNYASEQRDHYPRPEIFQVHTSEQDFGYYLNLQFFTTGSHVAAGEGPWKVGQNLSAVTAGVKPGHLRFVTLNVGNLREFTMEIAVASQLLWNSTTGIDEAIDSFCMRYFDPASAKAIRNLYHDYYYAYWQQKRPEMHDFERQYIFQDLRYARAAENLLSRLETGHYSAAPLFQDSHMLKIDPAYSRASDEPHAIVNGTAACIERLQSMIVTAKQLAARMPPVDSPYFDEAVESDIEFMLAANLFLSDVAQAYIAVNDENSADQHLAAAATHLQRMQAVLAERQRPYLAGWYEHETKFNLAGMAVRLEHARHLVLSRKSCDPSTGCISAHVPATLQLSERNQ